VTSFPSCLPKEDESLAALILALIAGGKAVALGAASGAASYGVKKGLDAATRRKRKKKAATPAEIQRFKRGLLRGNPGSIMGRRLKENACHWHKSIKSHVHTLVTSFSS